MLELTKEQRELLKNLIKYEGSEWGEQVSLMLNHFDRTYDDDIKEFLYKKLIKEVDYFNENYKFVEEEFVESEKTKYLSVVEKFEDE